MDKLQQLISEINEFGHLITQACNQDMHSDIQNACYLFSNYLDWRFKEITRGPRLVNTQFTWSVEELNRLDTLITPPLSAPQACQQWSNQLFSHCAKLERTKFSTA